MSKFVEILEDEGLKINAIELAKQYRQTHSTESKVLLHQLLRLLERAGISVSAEERRHFVEDINPDEANRVV